MRVAMRKHSGDPSDEERNGEVEQSNRQASREQGKDQAARLAKEKRVKSGQRARLAKIRRPLARRRCCRIDQIFKEAEHGNGMGL